ncbi:hypothetical protein EOL70_26370 [Leucothrix sargassi]|nr:hypothetical protein EOL70_26370 [Leucothrix sargassi]
MLEQDWIEELIHDVAKKYQVIVTPDDPILVTAVLNKAILDKAFKQHEMLFVKNSELLQQQFKAQRLSNEELINEVCHRLILDLKGFEGPPLDVPDAERKCGTPLAIAFLLAAFLFGVVSALVILHLF